MTESNDKPPRQSGVRSTQASPPIARGDDVIAFWRGVGKDGWFEKVDSVDQQFREKFYDLHFAAARQQCEHWIAHPDAGLALIILLDQFPRNVFRQTGHMFATDPLARYYARQYIDNGQVERVDKALQLFACLPFVHSEALSDQDYALKLYEHYAPENLGWAKQHRAIVARFGRFPHRNASLGRVTTPEEQEFLDSGGFAG